MPMVDWLQSVVAFGTKPRVKYSTVVGGRDNSTVREFAITLGGDQNEAYGNFGIAMGRKAKAKHNRSCVINCTLADDEATSVSHGEFRVSAKQFTISIDGVDAIINKDNIRALQDISSMQKQLKEQQEAMKKMQRQITALFAM